MQTSEKDLILIFYYCQLLTQVSSRQKETSSTAGMQESVKTSPLLKYRAEVWICSLFYHHSYLGFIDGIST